MIEKSNEYLFEVKAQNFGIDFKNFVNKFKDDLESDDEKVVEELINKYNIIVNKYQEKENKFESKIKDLNDKLKNADEDINNLEIKNSEEKNKNKLFLEQINELNNKYSNSQNLINELETMMDKKNKEIKELKELKSKIDSENIKRTDSYMNKLNEANSKLIQEKAEKIKMLEKELEIQERKIEDLTSSNKDLEHDYIKLNNKIKFITENKEPQPNNISLENEFEIISIKQQLENEIIKNKILENEILEMQTYINTQTNSKKSNLYEYQSIDEMSDNKPTKKCCYIM